MYDFIFWGYLNNQTFKNIFLIMPILLLIVTSLSFFLISKSFAIGIFLGGVIALLNFFLLVFTVKKIIFGDSKTQVLYSGMFMLKLIITAGVIFWLFKGNPYNFSKFGFLIGITILVVLLIIQSLVQNKFKTEVN